MKLSAVLREIKLDERIVANRDEKSLLQFLNMVYKDICSDFDYNIGAVEVQMTVTGGKINSEYAIPATMVRIKQVLFFASSTQSIGTVLYPLSADKYDSQLFPWRNQTYTSPANYYVEGVRIGIYPGKSGSSVAGGYPKLVLYGNKFEEFTSWNDELPDHPDLLLPLATGVIAKLYSLSGDPGAANLYPLKLQAHQLALNNLGRFIQRAAPHVQRRIKSRYA